MDRITVFSDIHANLPALQAVFDDMERRSAANIYCLGDLVGYGVHPNEVIESIRSRAIPTIMGNYDQGVGNTLDDCGCAYTNPISEALGKRSIAWSNTHTTDENKKYLRSLPFQISMTLGGLKVLLVHGSPRKINEYLFEERPEKGLERLLDSAGVDVLLCGHTHKPYHRILSSGRHVVNTGSVGKPKDHDPRAGYVMLNAEGSELTVTFVRVDYDVEAAARAIQSTDMPHEYAEMLRSGRG